MTPKYQVPDEVLALVKEGVFEELTQDGDWARSFGVITGTGYDVRVWVDREDLKKRTLPSKERYVVTIVTPSGELADEVSYAVFYFAMNEWESFATSRFVQGGPKDWSPVDRTTRPSRIRGYFRDKT